ncbi:MAG TPA: isochorismatase family cysteine hydrolase [Candidatus Bathyarchaeia archaeon]|nr:isochorismatase family cysteine hydrolase [Candidatus Bathyarchaeia archaeon]
MDEYTKPDYENIGLITIDIQNDFSLKGAVCEITGTYKIIPNMVRILKRFREKNKPIIHVVRIYKEDGSNVDICRKKRVEEGLRIVAPNSEGAEIVKELKPNNKKLDSKNLLNREIQEIALNEFVMYKPRWGAFYKTPLENFLKEKKISTLVFTGCNFPNCPRTSIFEASERDFRLVIIEDAISGIYEKGIMELRNICCEVMTTEEFLQKF